MPRRYGTRQRILKKKKILCQVLHSAKKLKKNLRRREPSANVRQSFAECQLVRDLALGKAGFTAKRFDGASLPSVALGKGFAECMGTFAECMGHSAKRVAVVVMTSII